MNYTVSTSDFYQQPAPTRREEENLEDRTPRTQRLLHALMSRGLPFGREDSFKILHQELSAERILLGTPAAGLGCQALLRIGEELGMPPCYEPLLREQFPDANVVLFGLEDREDGGLYKIYLEFWEQRRRHVRATGSLEPTLLDVGVKWDTRTGGHCRTDYVWYPGLSVANILSRLDTLYDGHRGQPSYELSVGLIRHAAARNSVAFFNYVEASEGGSPRKSFDVNLYKAELTVSDARPLLTRMGERSGVDPDPLGRLLGRAGGRCLGHLSGGFDRHGRDFATIYYEISMM